MNFINNTDVVTTKRLLKKITKIEPLAHPRKVDKLLALYGAGDLGQMANKYFNKIGIEVGLVVDKQSEIWRRKDCWNGVNVLSPEEVSTKQKKTYLLAICIVTIPYSPLFDVLQKSGWKDIVPFYDIAEAYRHRHPLSNGWFSKPFNDTDIVNTNRVINVWSDDISRAHHLQFIAWRLLREEWTFDNVNINIKNRFFIPEVVSELSEHESFVDVGAHYGRVTQKFIDITNSRFEKILMIEPDLINLSELKIFHSKINKNIRNKVKILPKAVGQYSGNFFFYEGLDYMSQLSDMGKTCLNITTIDCLGTKPTFIKLHLEGDELPTLKGAKETILKYRPIIVFTAYHNDDGIWKLPMWIVKNTIDYKLYLRLHSWCGTGMIIYCIPKNREQV